MAEGSYMTGVGVGWCLYCEGTVRVDAECSAAGWIGVGRVGVVATGPPPMIPTVVGLLLSMDESGTRCVTQLPRVVDDVVEMGLEHDLELV